MAKVVLTDEELINCQTHLPDYLDCITPTVEPT